MTGSLGVVGSGVGVQGRWGPDDGVVGCQGVGT